MSAGRNAVSDIPRTRREWQIRNRNDRERISGAESTGGAVPEIASAGKDGAAHMAIGGRSQNNAVEPLLRSLGQRTHNETVSPPRIRLNLIVRFL